MANTILHKRSSTPAGQPTTGQLALGELAVNTYDGKLYMKKNDGIDAIVEIGGNTVDIGDVVFSSTVSSDQISSTKDLFQLIGSSSLYVGMDIEDVPDFGFDVPSITATGNTASFNPPVSGTDMELAFIRNDGLAVYIVDRDVAPGIVYEFLLGTAWDLSTKAGTANASFTMSNLDHSDQVAGIWFSPDGLKFIVSGQSAYSEYSVPTAYDIANATFIQSVPAIGNFPSPLTFSQDGAHAYEVVRHATLSQWFVIELAVGTPWDVSTISQVGSQIRIDTDFPSTEEPSVAINNDGTKLIAVASNHVVTPDTAIVKEYDMITPYTISTMSLNANEKVLTGTRYHRYPQWSIDGTKLFTIDNNKTMYDYTSSALTIGGVTSRLYHNGNERLSTKNIGVSVTGSIDFSGANAQVVAPNFATIDLPATPIDGGIVYDTDTNTLKFYNGAGWEPVTPSPGGSDTQLQYNNGGAFGGIAEITYNDTDKTLTIADGTSITSVLKVENTSATAGAIGIDVRVNNSATSAAIFAQANGTAAVAVDGRTLTGKGIQGETDSTGVGVYGRSTTSASGAAGYFQMDHANVDTVTLCTGSNLIYGEGNGTPVLTVTNTGNADFAGNVVSHIAENAQTGSGLTAYTLVITDDGKLVTLTNASAGTIVIPLDASVNFPIGTQILISQGGAGQTSVSHAGTLNSAGGLTSLASQYSTATIIKTAADTWLLAGDLA